MKITKRKKLPFDATIQNIKKDASRGSVLVLAATIHNVLEGAITHNFVTLKKNDLDALFNGYGPLASFSAQISIGYAMGLYGKKMRHDLDTIRNIRNDFAHTIDDINLNEPEFLPKLQGLHSVQLTPDFRKLSAPELFATAAEKICMFLILRTAPSRLKAGEELMQQLKSLDFSPFTEIKKRDNEMQKDD